MDKRATIVSKLNRDAMRDPMFELSTPSGHASGQALRSGFLAVSSPFSLTHQSQFATCESHLIYCRAGQFRPPDELEISVTPFCLRLFFPPPVPAPPDDGAVACVACAQPAERGGGADSSSVLDALRRDVEADHTGRRRRAARSGTTQEGGAAAQRRVRIDATRGHWRGRERRQLGGGR